MNFTQPRSRLLSILSVTLLILGFTSYYLFRSDGPPADEGFTFEQMNEGGIEDIGTLALPEVEKRLNYLIYDTGDSLRSLELVMDSQLSLTIGGTEPASEQALQYEELFVPLTSAQLKAELASIQGLRFAQQLFADGSEVRLDTSSLDPLWKRAATPDEPVAAQYRPERLRFRDGSEKTFAELKEPPKVESDDMISSHDTFALAVNKPLASLGLTVAYRSYPGFRKVVLDKDHPKVTLDDGQSFQLTALGDAGASVRLSTPKLSTFVVQGVDDAGRALYSNGNNSRAFPSDGDIVALHDYYKALLQTKDDINQLKTGQAVQQQLVRLTEALAAQVGPLKNTEVDYHFEATPERIVIHVLDPMEDSTVEFTQVDNVLAAQARYIALDRKAERYGFIDQAGQWLIKPRWVQVQDSQMADTYTLFSPEKSSDPASGWQALRSQLAYFPTGSNKLVDLPFEYITEVLSNGLLLVERETNGPYGLYDARRHRFVLPMKFVNPTVTDNLFIARLGKRTDVMEGLYGAYTLDGKEILPTQFSGIEHSVGLLYASSADRSRQDVFDLQGKRINPQGYNVIGRFFGQQPLLVQDAKSRKFAFINRQGARLPIKLPYDEVEPFSNGMAVVGRDGNYGAIDLAGTLQVPLDYNQINAFQSRYAAAIRAGEGSGLVLISQNNKLIKELGSYTSLEVPDNGNEARYYVRDPSNSDEYLVYDADGNLVQKDE
ncbi:WG repeat-containing protein [Pseudomonas fluorescens]|uniref:WG repeat-containing protein n=1 Tax=Pseudomonas fluorescens TaxID=294 RepID=A0A944HI31_PSEFL|nr:WG repeat-containing protein [Pseudomonas fluorescens]MBT2295792.1 WG repeat-containing protein [Pseudomonas fluorescens]MBT2306049.1 WG repeat-containing protein [Pseudomonas fluorescens]MBT2314594.1 WG repeat-containing protein [Pseudomonas fluorescens]MBT2315657.1 WG repeat-containing protein [Pseudomonas fluorescens]MBT2331494.1 WG repeat-containing protein [Pseudomonas fluorescens]